MKIKIVIDESYTENEIIIKCHTHSDEIKNIQKMLENAASHSGNLIYYKGDKDYYFDLKNILFFDIEGGICYAHTKSDIYLVKHRLYELEQILPINFVRISKATIVNINHILSVSSSFGSSYSLEFNRSHKQVYVSRRYIKLLKTRLKERKNIYEN